MGSCYNIGTSVRISVCYFVTIFFLRGTSTMSFFSIFSVRFERFQRPRSEFTSSVNKNLEGKITNQHEHYNDSLCDTEVDLPKKDQHFDQETVSDNNLHQAF